MTVVLVYPHFVSISLQKKKKSINEWIQAVTQPHFPSNCAHFLSSGFTPQTSNYQYPNFPISTLD